MILRYLLIAIEVVVSLLLIGIILLQKSRSEGLGLAFGANIGESFFGSRAGNVLTRGTLILTIVFVLNTIALAWLYSGNHARHGLIERSSAPIQQPVGPASSAAPTMPMAPTGQK